MALHCYGQLSFLGLPYCLDLWSSKHDLCTPVGPQDLQEVYFHNIETLFVFFTVDSGPAGTKAVVDENASALQESKWQLHNSTCTSWHGLPYHARTLRKQIKKNHKANF